MLQSDSRMTCCRRHALRFGSGLFVLATLAAAPVPTAGQTAHTRVLLLFDEDRTLPGLSILDRTIRSTLRAGLGNDVEFFTDRSVQPSPPRSNTNSRCATTT